MRTFIYKFVYNPFLGALLFVVISSTHAIEKDWFSFVGEFDKTVGKMDVNVSLRKKAPMLTQPFLVMTSMKMNKSTTDGLDSDEELPTLLKFSKQVELIVKAKDTYSYAGNFTHEGVRINYFYVSDTIGLRQAFTKMYADQFPEYSLGLNLKEDKKWQTYFEFLFPGEDAIEQIKENRKQKARIDKGSKSK